MFLREEELDMYLGFWDLLVPRKKLLRHANAGTIHETSLS